MKARTDPIHVWIPGIREGSGGIQAFSRIYLRALREIHPQIPLRVFVKNDEPPVDDALHSIGIRFHSVAGLHPLLRTPALVAIGLIYGIRDRPCCALATHLHFLPALCLLRYLTGTPCAAVLHGIEAWHIKSRIRLLALRAADHLIAVSEFTRGLVIARFGVARERITVVPNTFDTERFKPGPKPDYLMERYGFRPGQPVLMTVSRLALSERYKGHRQVLVALTEIQKHFPDVRYLIVGEGDDAAGIRNAVQARNLKDCVVLAGHIPNSELADHYKLCDIFVMPSSKEGFGIVFLEAMASGKPVVAGCIDGSVDALRGGRLSPLVDPHNAADIGAAILKILRRDPADALWLQPDALSKAVTAEFGYPRVSQLMVEDIATMIRGGGKADAPGPSPSAVDRAPVTAPKVLLLVRSIHPAEVTFFNAVSAHGGFNLEVVYLTEPSEPLSHPSDMIAYNRVVFRKHPSNERDLMQTIRNSDLVIFGSLATAFAKAGLREGTAIGKACVLWLGMADIQPRGLFEQLLDKLNLDPLHRHPVPIWTTSLTCLESLRRKFGGSRSYRYVPFPDLPDPAAYPQRTGSSHGPTLDESVQRFGEAVGDAFAHWRARSSAPPFPG